MSKKKYWINVEELENTNDVVAETPEFVNDPFEEALKDTSKTNRRDFLKVLGFSVTSAAVLNACTKTPVRYALPYVNKPQEVSPSVSNYYASTFFDGLEYNSILVRTVEGRPVKIEGNPDSPITMGGVSARGQAFVLNLYDNERLKAPMKSGSAIEWKQADTEILQKLTQIRNAGGKVRVLTSSVISPASQALINDFLGSFPEGSGKHIAYDSISASGILEANERAFGIKAVPHYRFDNAMVIVGFNADFLGTWLSPTEYTVQYSQNRKVTGDLKISRHIQFESNLSLTGANADLRVPMKPSQEGACILKLYNEIAAATGKPTLGGGSELAGNSIAAAARDLLKAQGKALVVSGSNNPEIQLLVNGINEMLGSYGSTIDMDHPSKLRQGTDAGIAELLNEMNSGSVDALLIYDANPVLTYPGGDSFATALKKVGLTISFANLIDETADNCTYILSANHPLESWGDAEPYKNHFSIQQPAIFPIFDTRQFEDSLLKFSGKEGTFYDYLRQHWQENIYPTVTEATDFEKFWVNTLEKGVYNNPKTELTAFTMQTEVSASGIPAANKGGLELQLYQKVGIGSGFMAGNPWLQELPDPVTKITWDNYVQIPIKKAKELGIETGDIVKVEAGKFSVELPAHIQPGTQVETIAIAVGYGRTKVGAAAKPNPDDLDDQKGKNVYPAVAVVKGNLQYYTGSVNLTKTGGKYPLAATQIQLTSMGRHQVIKETVVGDYAHFVKEHNEERAVIKHHMVDLYPERPNTGHKWVMVIDLNLCTGCGACVVACNAENNIPVVGKKEVLRGREMHWMRIDRYYSAASDDPEDENAAENPQVIFQPMLCQHCNHAPCENVCPVLATVHSSEGLNQQAYNRCFGTRYCANNCPYKVRRFNWLDYANQDTPILGVIDSEKRFKYNPVHHLGKLVLNPDVTVRARGVMEKCSFCVQRLQTGKLEAKKAGRKLQDNVDIQTACQQTCPAGAIMFGDYNDPESVVHKYFMDERSFHVIEEVKTYPSISYLFKVRNRTKKDNDLNLKQS